MNPFQRLDHLAVLVANTEEALGIWRDRLGFPVVSSEVVNQGEVRLTHLDLGNTHLQLVEPLTASHPLRAQLAEQADQPCLHHLCFQVENVEMAADAGADIGLKPAQSKPHQGLGGKRALFFDPSTTGQVRVEITGT